MEINPLAEDLFFYGRSSNCVLNTKKSPEVKIAVEKQEKISIL